MPLPAPAGFRALSDLAPERGPESIVLVWEPVAGASGYRLTVAGSGANRSEDFGGSPAVAAGLIPNAAYDFSLAAIDDLGAVSPQTHIRVATSLPQPSPPQVWLAGYSLGAPARVAWDASALPFDAAHPAVLVLSRQVDDAPPERIVEDGPLIGFRLDDGAEGRVRYRILLESDFPDAPGGRNVSPPSVAAELTRAAFAALPTRVGGVPSLGLPAHLWRRS